MTVDSVGKKKARELGAEVNVDLRVRARGRIVARTFQAEPHYDIETPQGILSNVPESALRDPQPAVEEPSTPPVDEASESPPFEETGGDGDKRPAPRFLTVVRSSSD